MSDTTVEPGDPVQNRYDLVYFFDITDGNPNGDPDAGNLPRVDPETMQGLVTDVCLKRKIRNFVGMTHGEQPPYEIYVKERAVLNRQHDRAWQEVAPDTDAKIKKNLPSDDEKARQITRWMCRNFFDVRSFGAVMTTDYNAGQVRGPLQLGIARSLHPIFSQEHAVTRVAVTTEKEAKDQKGGNRTIGRKFTVPYALYRVHIYLNACLAEQTGFGTNDLALVRQALNMMFEHDRSAARANMRPVACYAFRHESKLGNARADQLFTRINVRPVDGVEPLPGSAGEVGDTVTPPRPPRALADYQIEIDPNDLPAGVEMEEWIAWPK